MNALNAGSSVFIDSAPEGAIVTPEPAVTPCGFPGKTIPWELLPAISCDLVNAVTVTQTRYRVFTLL